MRLALLLSLSFPLLFPACSSGGKSGSNAAAPQGATVLLDTAAGGDYGLDARVDVLSLERADGSFTPNLLPTGASISLARLSGAATGVNLPTVPAGTYVAMRLLLAEDGVRATGRTGVTEPCAVSNRDVRASFAAPTAVTAGAGNWLVLSHAAAPALTRNAGVLTWQPNLAARRGDVQPLAEVVFAVAARSGDDVVGTLSNCGGLAARGRIDDSTSLSDDSGNRDRAGFLRDLRSGDDLVCDGVLTSDGSFSVRRAHRRSRGVGEGKIYGQITELVAATPAIKVQVQEIVRATAGLQTSPLPLLTVLTGDAFIYRSGARTTRLEFGALAVGQRVEVEWRGAVADATVRAHEVEIEDGSGNGGGFGNEIEGAVGSIDVAQGLLVAVPRGDDPLLVGGQSVPSATIVIGADTVITREVDNSTTRVALAQAQVGDRVWVWGRVVEPRRVEAVAVRLRTR